MGDGIELKNKTNWTHEAYSKASLLYGVSYTQLNHRMPFHGLYPQLINYWNTTYSVLENKTENTLSLLIIIHTFRIFSDIKSYVRVSKSETYLMEETYQPVPISSLSVLQSIYFSASKSSQFSAWKYGPLTHAPDTYK